MIIEPSGVLTRVNPLDVKNGLCLIPPSVNKIGEKAFIDVPFVNQIIINNSVKCIESHAFENTTFENIVVPESVNILGNEIFYGNSNLQEVKINNPSCILSATTFSFALALRKITVGKKLYAVRSFPDGVVWEVNNKHGYDVVQIYSGRELFTDSKVQLCGRKMQICVYGDSPASIVKECNRLYYTKELALRYKDLNLDSKITANDYRIITGCCFQDWWDWIQKNLPLINSNNIDKITMSVREIIKLTENQPGNRLLTQFLMDRYKDREEKTITASVD